MYGQQRKDPFNHIHVIDLESEVNKIYLKGGNDDKECSLDCKHLNLKLCVYCDMFWKFDKCGFLWVLENTLDF